MLRDVRWPRATEHIALGVGFAESEGFIDAVGDITLTDDVYSVSSGWFQNRAEWYPHEWGQIDWGRHVYPMVTSPWYNAQVALVISKGGTDFNPWTTFRTGAWEQFDDKDYTLRTGHVRAAEWRRGIVRSPEQIIAEAGAAIGLSSAQVAQMVLYARTHRSKILASNPLRPT